MKKSKVLFLTAVILTLLAYMLCSCTYDSARRYIQNDPNDIAEPDTPSIPDNLIGKTGNTASNSKISATYEVVDFSYLTIKDDNLNVRTGAGTKYPTIGTIRSGQKIRAFGKLDGWYIIQLPNSGKIGCIPAATAKPETTSPSASQGAATGGGTETETIGADTAGGGTPSAGSGTMNSDESKILQLVNAERSKAGLKALTSNGSCTKLARMKSQDMVNNNYFSHQSPTYGSPFDMLKANKVSYMYAGENIAMDQSAEAAFRAWMNSEGHKKNILNPNFTELGVGIAPKGNRSYIYTQLFIGR